MARIRSIKPEFVQSETIGNLSRDARLLFVQLWTYVDDEGRARGASRMLASLLFPYDHDAPELIEGWLAELQREGCIRRYDAKGSRYIDIPNWLKHQKIDHPGKSKIPPFEEGSEILANVSEGFAPDLGPRTRDLGEGSEGSEAIASAAVQVLPEPEPTYADATDELWRRGPVELDALGVKESRVKGLIGKWRKDAGDDAAVVIAAIRRASALRIADPIPWITQAVQQQRRQAPGRPPPVVSPSSVWAARRNRSESVSHESPQPEAVQLPARIERGHGPVRGTLLEQDRGGSVRQIDDFGAVRAFGR